MNNSIYVDSCEELYRRILPNERNPNNNHYTIGKSGNVIIESAAFLGGEKPSVDRAKLTGFDPEYTKDQPTDGVISIIAESVKSICIRHYTADVKITPSENNDAHAEIVLIPEEDIIPKKVLSLLRNSLAEVATCIVNPEPL